MAFKECLGFNPYKEKFLLNGEGNYPYFDNDGILNVEAVMVDDTEITYICPCCKNKGTSKPVLHRHGSCGDKSKRKTHRSTHCIGIHKADPSMKGVYIHITDRTLVDFKGKI